MRIYSFDMILSDKDIKKIRKDPKSFNWKSLTRYDELSKDGIPQRTSTKGLIIRNYE